MKSKPDWSLFKWYLVGAALLILAAALCSSCEILKTRSELKADSTHKATLAIDTKDSTAGGAVSKINYESKDDYEKWRAIFTYPRDTNVSVTNVYPQPTTVIYEREKGTKTEATNKTDSSWFVNVFKHLFNALDSTNSKVDRIDKSKHSETKGLGLFTIVLLLLGYLVVSKGADFVFSNYSFTKKK